VLKFRGVTFQHISYLKTTFFMQNYLF